MKISEVINHLESIAPRALQESYDNAGLITGDPGWECKGIICSLDATEEVVDEAIAKKCNLVVAHHPIIFRGLKKINGKNYVERTVIKAIKNDIAIYAIHTNLDNVLHGVSGRMAEVLGLKNVSILSQREQTLRKIFTFVPAEHADKVRNAMFAAGAGQIGRYSECSFNTSGTGTFKAGEGADPFVGKIDERHHEQEIRVEAIFPSHSQSAVVNALLRAHPYEEVAYDVVQLVNTHPLQGSGVVGELPSPMDPKEFLSLLKKSFGLEIIRHSAFPAGKLSRVALCGGAGSFLIPNALSAGAQVFVTGDMKYHEFFDGEDRMAIADIGHFESERFTIDLLQEILEQKFTTFAVLKTSVNTNPLRYFS